MSISVSQMLSGHPCRQSSRVKCLWLPCSCALHMVSNIYCRGKGTQSIASACPGLLSASIHARSLVAWVLLTGVSLCLSLSCTNMGGLTCREGVGGKVTVMGPRAITAASVRGSRFIYRKCLFIHKCLFNINPMFIHRKTGVSSRNSPLPSWGLPSSGAWLEMPCRFPRPASFPFVYLFTCIYL